ncbi:MAG TPA: GAF domain-containing protein [Anaerolineae bacterium]|nr:GAF domain-containing protein [Anaerolineae bacterium]
MEGEDRPTLEQKLAQKEKELELILAIDRICDATADVGEMLSAVVEVVAGSLEADLGLASLVNEETGAVELQAVDDRAGVSGRLGQELVQQMLERATALDGVSSLESLPELREHGLGHLLAAPLAIEDRRLGALLLLRGERAFTAADVDLMRAAVGQADSAVMHARTYERLHRHMRELEVIYQVDRIRDVTVEPHSMLSAIINVVVEELEAGLGLVSLVDEETGAVELKAIDDRVGAFRRLEWAVVQQLMEQATALEGVSFMRSPSELQARGLPHLLAAPLIIGGQRLGALVLLRGEDGFGQADVDLLEAVVSQADSAVVQARTYQRLQQRNRELEAIYQVDRIRDATTDTQELLSSIANMVTSSLGADLCLMSLVGEESGAAELKAIDDRLGVFGRLERDVVQRVVERSAALDQVSLLEEPALKQKGMGHLLAAPLIVGGERLGSLLLLNSHRRFGPADMRLLEAVVSQADSAVVHARTYARLQQRNKELEVIYRVDRVRDSGLDFDSMLNAVLNELCQAIEAEVGFIMLFDRTGQQLELKASTGDNIFAMAEHYHLVEEAAEEALYLGDLVNRPALSAEIHSLICVPLVLREEIIGVFGAINRRGLEGFGQEDERLLLAITSQVDTAIFESLERQRIRSTFSRYVSPKVVDLMLRTDQDFLKADRALLTVLFSDMRGFTSITERTDPDILMSFLNEHLAAMTEVIDRYEGTVDKFVGDEVVALFGAPMPMEDHARRAVCTALEMQQAHQKLMAAWLKAGHEAVPIGIGINTGEMIVGNIGCQRQMDYTAIGDNMNLASRICGVARGGQVLVSQTTYQLICQDVVAHELPLVQVKGKARPVQLYEVVALV